MICRTCKAQMEEVSRKELPMCDVVQRRCACGIQEAMEVTSDRWQSTMGSLGSAYFGMKKLREDEGEKKERETVAKLRAALAQAREDVRVLADHLAGLLDSAHGKAPTQHIMIAREMVAAIRETLLARPSIQALLKEKTDAE